MIIQFMKYRFKECSYKKNALMTLNSFKNENAQKVFCESKHSLPRFENVKNS